MKTMNKYLIVAALVTGAIAMPARKADAWIAAGHWGGGGVHVAVYHPYPTYAGVGAAAVAGFALGRALSPPVVVTPSPIIVTPAPIIVQQPTYAMPPSVGSSVNVLPAGSKSLVVNGTQYYQSGSAWYRPYFGSSGVYYTVVSPP